MRVIFLDVDGVLNNFELLRQNGFDYIDPGMVALVGLIVKKTKAKIVLSSSWRLDAADMRLVGMALGEQGLFIYDTTPKSAGARSHEISSWLESNPSADVYAVLDDDEDAGFGMSGSFFQTDPEVGLTEEIAMKVVEHLNGDRNG
jgi:hypothetical protein